MTKQEYLKVIDEVIEKGPFDASWESLCEHDTPKWYKKDKFGIFIHWGIYSVPAFGNEWYARYVYRKNSPEYKYHVEKYGPLDQFGYKDFIPMFKAEKFDANEWAELFEESGAKFVMPVAEHHDGFQMYDSEFSKWNAKNMGPKVDIVGELKKAVEAKDMKLCTSSHRAEHWWFFNYGRTIDSDVNDPEYDSLYGPAKGVTLNGNSIYDNPPDDAHMEDWLIRTCEIVDKYQPKIMFFDWWIQVVAWKPYLKKFAAYYYNRAAEWGVEVAIDAKFDAYVHGSAVPDIERGQLAEISPVFWQNDTSVAKNSWGYTENNDYKTPDSVISDLVDVVSKNGALLLNVGPKADGTIPEEDAHILREVGKWLKVNGEAIYDTTPWKVYGEGPTEVPEGHFTDTNRAEFTSKDIRYTAKADAIYAIVMKWPEDGIVNLKEVGTGDGSKLKAPIKKVSILGHDVDPLFEIRSMLEINAKIEADQYPVVIKIEIM
ncbi:MAG: alpha-L-fucosidase [Eubacteriales bacterium]